MNVPGFMVLRNVLHDVEVAMHETFRDVGSSLFGEKYPYSSIMLYTYGNVSD